MVPALYAYLVLVLDKLQDIRSKSHFSMLFFIAGWEDIVYGVDLEDELG